jgi:chromosome segregation ATPase
LIFYAALTIQALWMRNRSLTRQGTHLLERAVEQRLESEARAEAIESELEQIRLRFHSIEPTQPEQVSEVSQLREERKSLEGKLAGLELRELELRESAARESALGQEISALEDLLEEASEDLATRGQAIRDLEKNLKRASKGAASEETARTRESDVLNRRFAALYRNLEVDDRAIQDIVALRDEAMKLKCEEKLKRLNDEADNLSVRRKVGGIPPHLTIFEMGFAGKGRLYYMKGRQRRFRVLNVGAKNTQNASIEYLRRL